VDVVGRSNSRTFIMLSGGRILTEAYWGGAETTSTMDVASCQKSVMSSLVGIAVDRGMLALEDPVSIYLGDAWSNAAVEDEQQITVLHLLTMTSGLDVRRLTKAAEPGAIWAYNTDAYQKLRPVVEVATGMGIDTLTRQWILGPIGASAGAQWAERSNAAPDATGAIPWGLKLTVRDMARYGLLVQRSGTWGDEQIVPATWLEQALSPIPQKADYGYLWWLLGRGHLAQAGAPEDMVAALGALDQKIYVVPSADLVVARQGLAAGGGSDSESDFDTALIKVILAARA
jgi:CubicO group peptidase (beta-lactamase class C family)